MYIKSALAFVCLLVLSAHSLHTYVPGPRLTPQTVTDVTILDTRARRYNRGGDLGYVGHTPNGAYVAMGDIDVKGRKREVALFKAHNLHNGQIPFVKAYSGKIAGNMQWHPRLSMLLGVLTDKGSLVEGMQSSRLTNMFTGFRAKWSFDSFPRTGSTRQWGLLDDIDADALYAIGHDMGSGARKFSSTNGRAFVLRCYFSRDCFQKRNWQVVWNSGKAKNNTNLYGSRGGRRLYIGVQRLPGHQNMISVVNDWDTKVRHVQIANTTHNNWDGGFRTLNRPSRADQIQSTYKLSNSKNHGEMTGAFVYNRGQYWYLSTGWPGAWDALYVSKVDFKYRED